MHRTIFHVSCPSFAFPARLPIGAALAEPKAPTEEENADANFAKSFLGKTYSGDLEIEDWTDFGGGLVAPPIWVHQYQREDGTNLVLTSRETVPETRSIARDLVVTDARIISKPWKGYAIVHCLHARRRLHACASLGDARGPEEKEWWTDVRRAWEISLAGRDETDQGHQRQHVWGQ